jgi:site-specific DNA-methyltransferase (adenine-specific)
VNNNSGSENLMRETTTSAFIGSGQAAIAATKTRRHYVGYDINEEYVKLAERRTNEFRAEINSQGLLDLRQKKAK